MQGNLALEVQIRMRQRRVRKCGYQMQKKNDSAWKLAAAGTNQDLSFQECARKLAPENFDINDEGDSKWPHNYLEQTQWKMGSSR